MKTCHPHNAERVSTWSEDALLQNSKRAQKILPFLPKKRKYLPQTSRTLTCPGTFLRRLLRLCFLTKMRNAKSNYVLLTFFFFWFAGISFWRCIPYTFFFFGLKCFCKTWQQQSFLLPFSCGSSNSKNRNHIDSKNKTGNGSNNNSKVNR